MDDFRKIVLGDIKLKMRSKKLHSGSHQIKFKIIKTGEKELQGYLLAKPDSTLKEVVKKITDVISLVNGSGPRYKGQLYSMNLKINNKHGPEVSPVVYVKSELSGLYKY